MPPRGPGRAIRGARWPATRPPARWSRSSSSTATAANTWNAACAPSPGPPTRRRDPRRGQRLDRWIARSSRSVSRCRSRSRSSAMREPLVLGGQRAGRRNRRRRVDLLPQQRRRSHHRGLARLPGRDDGPERRRRRRGAAHLSAPPGRRRAGIEFADLSLQHDGVAFDRGSAVPTRRASWARARIPWPCATSGRRAAGADGRLPPDRPSAFDAVGGFSTDYDYGLEDVDLCLKLRAAGGRLIYDGRAALWHHESATRAAEPAATQRGSSATARSISTAWGPRIFREAFLDALSGGTAGVSAPPSMSPSP